MVTLECDVAAVGFGKEGHAAKLACVYSFFEVVAAESILEVLYAVNLVYALLGAYEQADVIPPARGFCCVERPACFGVERGLVECIEPSAANRIGCFGVVL